jgi:HlyD family secretion protein
MLFKNKKRRFFWLLTAVAFLGAIFVGYTKLQAYWKKSANNLFREATIRRGDIKFEVKCTGRVDPILSVQVGAFVSGPIQKVCVDFNDKVTKDQLLAELDPQVFEAQCRQAKAMLDHSEADLLQSRAKLRQADRDYKRAQALYKKTDNPQAAKKDNCISESDYDLYEANFEMAGAAVKIAEATVDQNKAALDMATTNRGYTTIRSPVDGIVIDRKVDAGQTLASQYQTPVMFVVAPELDKRVWIFASIDEADIGLVRKAEANKLPVQFTVDAYQNEKFEGKIVQVRLGPKAAAQQNMPVNVVTYVTVVEAPNTDLKLLPGMTANLVFRVDRHDNVVKLPNAALRFHPKPEFVHPKHMAVLEGLKTEDEQEQSDAKDKAANDSSEPNGHAAVKDSAEKKDADGSADANNDGQSDDKTAGGESAEKAKTGDKDSAKGSPAEKKKKYVWVIDGERLAPIEVKTGLSDSRHTELVAGELKEGSKVVTGMKTAAEADSKK